MRVLLVFVKDFFTTKLRQHLTWTVVGFQLKVFSACRYVHSWLCNFTSLSKISNFAANPDHSYKK